MEFVLCFWRDLNGLFAGARRIDIGLLLRVVLPEPRNAKLQEASRAGAMTRTRHVKGSGVSN